MTYEYITSVGTVVSVHRQWWLKINAKAIRMGPLDGATFPHIIKVKYTAEGIDYFKRKWIPARDAPPCMGSKVTVLYCDKKPAKAKIIC